jgi:hypothetical protein
VGQSDPTLNSHRHAHYEVRPRKRYRGVDLISDAAIRSTVLWRAERNQQCNRLRKILSCSR